MYELKIQLHRIFTTKNETYIIIGSVAAIYRNKVQFQFCTKGTVISIIFKNGKLHLRVSLDRFDPE